MASRLAYIAEWLDTASGVLWKYQLFWYPDTKEVEVRGASAAAGCWLHAHCVQHWAGRSQGGTSGAHRAQRMRAS